MCKPFSNHQTCLVFLLPLSSHAAESKKSNYVSTTSWHQPFHRNIDFVFLLHFLSNPILNLPHPSARFSSLLSCRQALCSAEHPPEFTGLFTLNSRMLCIRTLKSGPTCLLHPFTAYVFPSHKFNILYLTFLISFIIFLFLLPFTAFNFSI